MSFLERIKKRFDLDIVKCIELEVMSIDFTGPDPWVSTLASDHLIAKLKAIPGFSWPIRQVQLKVLVQDNGHDIGRFESPFQPATVVGGIVTSSLSRSTMAIFPQSHEAFSDFVSSMVTQHAHTFAIRGQADIIFDLGFLGVHTIRGVDFLSDLTLRGLQNLPQMDCRSIAVAVIPEAVKVEGHAVDEGMEANARSGSGKDAYELVLDVVVDLLNPSQLSLTLGDISLACSILYGEDTTTDHFVGVVTLKDLVLLTGMNAGKEATVVLDTSLEATKVLLRELQAGEKTVLLKGFNKTSANEALVVGLVKLSTKMTLPQFDYTAAPVPVVVAAADNVAVAEATLDVVPEPAQNDADLLKAPPVPVVSSSSTVTTETAVSSVDESKAVAV